MYNEIKEIIWMNIPYIFILLEENKKFFMRILNNSF